MAFKDLTRDELYRSAIEDFAVDIEADANKDDIVAEFAAMGIKWKDYVAQHPEAAPAEETKVVAPVVDPNERVPEPPRAGAVITTQGMHREEPITAPGPAFVVAEGPVVVAEKQYLVKMIRPNIYFETNGYKFSDKHPYALVDGKDLNAVLEGEDGFRQAYPSEVEEFYG